MKVEITVQSNTNIAGECDGKPVSVFRDVSAKTVQPVDQLSGAGIVPMASMLDPRDKVDRLHASSVGQEYCDNQYLDQHFTAMESEYCEMVQKVGIVSGEAVLDAGCGGGSFLTIFSGLVGPHGHLAAVDLDSVNIQHANELGARGLVSCFLEAKVGSVCALPFTSNSFDVVWIGNVFQYLEPVEMKTALEEVYRVLKTGGRIALKEADSTKLSFGPSPQGAVQRLLNHIGMENLPTRNCLNVVKLSSLVADTQFSDVQYDTFLGERHNPMTPIQTQFVDKIVGGLASYAVKVKHQVHSDFWESMRNNSVRRDLLASNRFYFQEAHVLIMGYKLD